MSDRADTLLLELLDSVRAQRSALEEGDTDKALALLPKRQGIIREIQINNGPVSAAGRSGRSDDVTAVRRSGSLESRRSTLNQILAADREIAALVRPRMRDIASRLEGIDMLKRYFRNAASALGGNDGVVA